MSGNKHGRWYVNGILFIIVCLIIFACSCGTHMNDDRMRTATEYGQSEKYRQENDSSADIETASKEPWAFSLDMIPEYSGDNSIVLNDNIPVFKEIEISPENPVHYSELDALGRCGVALAEIGMETMPTEARGPIGPVEPSGWQTVKYNDIIDGNYLYNRCHLIAYQLAGENDEERNLITGTRWMNVQGMLPFENQLAEYVRSTGNHVLYQVQPVFAGDNLVASGVWMEAMSVEDDGKSLSYNVYVYNIQPGIGIDYTTGDSRLADDWEAELAAAGISLSEQAASGSEPSAQNRSEDADTEAFSVAADPSDKDVIRGAASVGQNEIPKEVTYVANTNTKKFHRPSCESVRDMADHNKAYFYGDRDEVISAGYEPCKRCRP